MQRSLPPCLALNVEFNYIYRFYLPTFQVYQTGQLCGLRRRRAALWLGVRLPPTAGPVLHRPHSAGESAGRPAHRVAGGPGKHGHRLPAAG